MNWLFILFFRFDRMHSKLITENVMEFQLLFFTYFCYITTFWNRFLYFSEIFLSFWFFINFLILSFPRFYSIYPNFMSFFHFYLCLYNYLYLSLRICLFSLNYYFVLFLALFYFITEFEKKKGFIVRVKSGKSKH